ncbi:MAG: hypothetical protein ACRD0K_28320 [Egibacteraceae bacterium]
MRIGNPAVLGFSTALALSGLLYGAQATRAEEAGSSEVQVGIQPDPVIAVPATHRDPVASVAEVNLDGLLETLGLAEEDEPKDAPVESVAPPDKPADRSFGGEFTGPDGTRVEGRFGEFAAQSDAPKAAHPDDDEPLLSLFNVEVPFFPFGDDALFSLIEVDTAQPLPQP